APRGDHLRPCVAHASAYAAVQIWSIVYRPSATTVSLMLSTVTATGFSRNDGTASPLAVSAVVSALGDSPWASATASSAALYASGLNALYTVMNWSPARIRWMPDSEASCPVTGGSGVMPPAFSAAMAPPAVSSFASYTPVILSPNLVT